jgi:hypothetical protein
MPLPKLNDVPKYDIVIPSTKVKTKFRPYLVKEEKLLFLAIESGDDGEIAASTLGLCIACIDADLDPLTLTTYDIDFMFCQIRSKSVGETVNLKIQCEDTECDGVTEVPINISEAYVDGIDFESMIEINKDVSLEMQHVTYLNAQKINLVERTAETGDYLQEMIASSIKAIHTENERLEASDSTEAEMIEFLDQMTTDQYNKLREFVAEMPIVTIKTKWKCVKCSKDQDMLLKGLNDFFQ